MHVQCDIQIYVIERTDSPKRLPLESVLFSYNYIDTKRQWKIESLRENL